MSIECFEKRTKFLILDFIIFMIASFLVISIYMFIKYIILQLSHIEIDKVYITFRLIYSFDISKEMPIWWWYIYFTIPNAILVVFIPIFFAKSKFYDFYIEEYPLNLKFIKSMAYISSSLILLYTIILPIFFSAHNIDNSVSKLINVANSLSTKPNDPNIIVGILFIFITFFLMKINIKYIFLIFPVLIIGIELIIGFSDFIIWHSIIYMTIAFFVIITSFYLIKNNKKL